MFSDPNFITSSGAMPSCRKISKQNEFETKLKTYIQRKYTNLQIKALSCKLDIFTPYATLDAKRTYDDDNETS